MEPWQPTDEQQHRLGAGRRRRLLPRHPRTDRRPERGRPPTSTSRRTADLGPQIYLADRLGTDLTGDPHIQPGYAPAGLDSPRQPPAPARRHRRLSCSPPAWPEIATTGTAHRHLPRPARPAHPRTRGVIVGFVGRRNPDNDRLVPGTDAAVKAGPKYLNTGDTVLFAKGDQLYGHGRARRPAHRRSHASPRRRTHRRPRRHPRQPRPRRRSHRWAPP